jgi:hypothetical protein
MTGHRVRVPKFAGAGAPLTLPALRRQPADPSALRQDFASRVVRRLAGAARIAVIADRGRPAMVNCTDGLYELLAKDHPIVGVYTADARIKHIIEDLEAAGL